jgi:hypothetical protein
MELAYRLVPISQAHFHFTVHTQIPEMLALLFSPKRRPQEAKAFFFIFSGR